MIERKFLENKVRDYKIKRFLIKLMDNVGLSRINVDKTPLGFKITIYSSKPGLIVGKGGSNIKKVTAKLEEKFGLKSPQIEIEEIVTPELDAQIVAERVAYQIERFGKSRFKAIGYRSLQSMVNSGAVGAEVIISGRIPGKRHNTWRFKSGRLPKNGYVADHLVDKGFKEIRWNQGSIGVKVRLLKPGTPNPDTFKLVKEAEKNDNQEE